MKASVVFRKAAELIDSGSERKIFAAVSSAALADIMTMHMEGGLSAMYLVSGDFGPVENKLPRVLALLFMAEIAKDEERK